MNYQQTIDYLFSKLPMFHRIGKSAYKEDLKNITALCHSLGRPQNQFKSIHIAGTNGKGSTSHLIASVLQECGFRVGLFTSPHLKDFRERIKINGKMIPKREVMLFVQKMKNDFHWIKPSFFEMSTALAFDYFARKKVDFAVIEVGMGGRLDSTNIIYPILSVITNIGLDHTQFLGDSLEKIAWEKSGIIKKKIPVVIGEYQKETENVFLKKAKEMASKIIFADQFIKKQPFETSLKGNYQRKNKKTALAAIEVLNEYGFRISPKNIGKGFLNVIENTGLRGRWEILSHLPLTICDVGHNKEGIREVIKQISETPHRKLHFVFGMVNDKNHDEILALMPGKAIYYFCKPDLPRGLGEKELKSKAEKFNLKGKDYSSVKKALAAAQKKAGPKDLIFIGGSTFVVAEIV